MSYVAITFLFSIVLLFCFLSYMACDLVTKIEILFVDKLPIVCLHKRRFFLFLSTYVEKYKNLKKIDIQSKDIVTNNGFLNVPKTFYELVFEFRREQQDISKNLLGASETKKIVAFRIEASDTELRWFNDKLNKLNKALKQKEDSVISIKDIKTNLKKCVLTYVKILPIVVILLVFMYLLGQKEFIAILSCYPITGLMIAFLIFMSFRINRKAENNGYSIDNFGKNNKDMASVESVEADKIKDSIIK